MVAQTVSFQRDRRGKSKSTVLLELLNITKEGANWRKSKSSLASDVSRSSIEGSL